MPTSSNVHDRLLGDMAIDFIPLRVVRSGKDIVEEEREDVFGTQIVSYGHNFEV